MKINVQAKNIELTSAIREYAEKRVVNLEKFLSNIEEKGGEVKVVFEVSKTTHHHHKGDVFRSEININAGKMNYRAVSEQSDLYASIDDAKEEVLREITSSKDKHRTLFRRGASSIKKMLKGLSKRNPFTSKY